jgi:predicted  nucleic acid-binding Zn-ribbon protein
MTVTEEILEDLWECARKGVPYEEVYGKWENSKGPFYNALARFFSEAEAEVSRLGSEYREAQGKLAQLQAKNTELEREVKEKEERLSSLAQKERETEERVGKLEERERQKRESLESLGRLERAGVGAEELKRLLEVLREISARRGVGLKEAVGIFFSLLPTFDPTLGLELEARRLQNLAEAKRTEAEKWGAEAERLRARCAEDRGAVEAVRSLIRMGARDHLFAWERILKACGKSPVELEGELKRYGSLAEAVRGLEERRRGLEQEVQALEGRKGGLSAYLRAIQEEGIRKMEETRKAGETSISSLTRVAEASIQQQMSGLRTEVERAMELMMEAGRLEEDVRTARVIRAWREEPEVLSQLSKEEVLSLLDSVREWVKLTGFNPTAKEMILEPPGFGRLIHKLLEQDFSLREVLNLARWLLLLGVVE